ncbi:MAG: monovalent cation/H+ antiporter subunit D family protein [Verrucomicrobiae bacterium]|nr:monovalent cation/H+ antiporter subunit D family protein [Verrucomicrobiae bacterium]
MSEQLPAILLLSPLFGALITGLVGMTDHRRCFPILATALTVSLFCAISLLAQVVKSGPIDYFVGGWDPQRVPLGIGIQLRIDGINALLLVVITTVALLTSIYSIRRAGEENTEKTPQFYMLSQMLCVGLLGITVTADAFNLFVLVEVSSLTSYALVAMGSKPRGTMAAFNYIIMGTIGASFYLLGVGYLYMKTGMLNMAAIHQILSDPNVGHSPTVYVAFILILVGVWTKMAFFPLYGWLPNAYSYCPSTTSCLLAPLMTKVSVYVMIRVMLSVFGSEWIFQSLGWSHTVVWLACIAIVAGSVLALAQVELKKMLCYLIVAEVGYMVGGAWLANHWGMVGAIYHILSDAFMTLCLFIAANIFIKNRRAERIDQLEGLFKKMPITTTGFVIGALAMIGVPPTAGFFSKWYLLRGGIESGQWGYVVALLISSLVNAILFFRIFEVAYFGKNPVESHDAHHDHEDETQPSSVGDSTLFSGEGRPTTVIPLLITAAIIVLLGVFNGPIVEIIQQALDGMPVVGAAIR